MVDSTLIRSAVFGVRNVEKTEQGHVGKAAVAGGQLRNAVFEARKYDGVIGETADTAVKALQGFAKETKVLEVAGKALKIAGDYVNPLICVSAGIDVALSDDKEKAFVENSMGLGGMFVVESLMKKHLDSVVKIKGIDKIAEKVMKFASTARGGKYIPAIIHGGAFVVGSCLAYSASQKFGDVLMGADKKAKTAPALSPAVAAETPSVSEQPAVV